MLPQAAYGLACDLFDEIATAAGLTAVKESGASRGLTPRCFELDADTEIETHDHGAMTVAELEHLMRVRQARGDMPAATMRCSGSFHDSTRVRTDSHLINWGRYGLGIHDTMTETTWHRRERAPIEDTMIANILLLIAQRREVSEMSDPEMLTPPPPEPTTDDAQKQAVFDEVVIWLRENFALIATGEQRGSGRIAPIRTRTATSTVISAFKTIMLPYRIEIVGPRGGITKVSPVDIWLTHAGRVEAAGFRTRRTGLADLPKTAAKATSTSTGARNCPRTATLRSVANSSRRSCRTTASGRGSSRR